MGQKLGRCLFVRELEPFLGLSKADVDELWNGFNEASNGFGLSLVDLQEICGGLQPGHTFSDPIHSHRLQDIFVAFDTDKNNLIDALEFLGAIILVSGMWDYEKVQYIFDVFDFNGLGHISVDEATLAVKTALTGISNLHAMLSPETAEIEGFLKSTIRRSCQSEAAFDGQLSRSTFTELLLQQPETRSWINFFRAPVIAKHLKTKGYSWQGNMLAGLKEDSLRDVEWAAKSKIESSTATSSPEKFLDIPSQVVEHGAHELDVELQLEWIYGGPPSVKLPDGTLKSSTVCIADGELVYACGSTLTLFDVEKGQQRHCREHQGNIASLDVDIVHGLIATGERAPVPCIKIFDSYSLSLVKNIRGLHRDAVTCLAFSPSGDEILSVGADDMQRVAVFAVPDGTALYVTQIGTRLIEAGKFLSASNPVSGFALCGRGAFYSVWIYEPYMSKERNLVMYEGILPSSMQEAPASRLSALSPATSSGAPHDVDLNSEGSADDFLCLSTFGSVCLVGSSAGKIYCWSGRNCVKAVQVHSAPVTSVTTFDDETSGLTIAAGTEDCTILLLEESLVPKAQFNLLHLSPILRSHKFSTAGRVQMVGAGQNGSTLMVLFGSGEIFEISAFNGTNVRSGPLTAFHSPCYEGKLNIQIAVHPHKPHLCSAGADGVIRLWNYDRKGLLLSKAVAHPISALCYHPHGHCVIVAFDDHPGKNSEDVKAKRIQSVSQPRPGPQESKVDRPLKLVLFDENFDQVSVELQRLNDFLQEYTSPAVKLQWSPCGSHLAVGFSNATVVVAKVSKNSTESSSTNDTSAHTRAVDSNRRLVGSAHVLCEHHCVPSDESPSHVVSTSRVLGLDFSKDCTYLRISIDGIKHPIFLDIGANTSISPTAARDLEWTSHECVQAWCWQGLQGHFHPRKHFKSDMEARKELWRQRMERRRKRIMVTRLLKLARQTSERAGECWSAEKQKEALQRITSAEGSVWDNADEELLLMEGEGEDESSSRNRVTNCGLTDILGSFVETPGRNIIHPSSTAVFRDDKIGVIGDFFGCVHIVPFPYLDHRYKRRSFLVVPEEKILITPLPARPLVDENEIGFTSVSPDMSDKLLQKARENRLLVVSRTGFLMQFRLAECTSCKSHCVNCVAGNGGDWKERPSPQDDTVPVNKSSRQGRDLKSLNFEEEAACNAKLLKEFINIKKKMRRDCPTGIFLREETNPLCTLRPWKEQLCSPLKGTWHDFDEESEDNQPCSEETFTHERLPDSQLTLEWVFGYSPNMARNNISYDGDKNLLYTAGAALIQRRSARKQRHFVLRDGVITAIAQAPGRHLVALGSSGPQPSITICDTRSMESVLELDMVASMTSRRERFTARSSGIRKVSRAEDVRGDAVEWAILRGTEQYQVGHALTSVESLAFSDDSSLLAVVGRRAALPIYDAQNEPNPGDVSACHPLLLFRLSDGEMLSHLDIDAESLYKPCRHQSRSNSEKTALSLLFARTTLLLIKPSSVVVFWLPIMRSHSMQDKRTNGSEAIRLSRVLSADDISSGALGQQSSSHIGLSTTTNSAQSICFCSAAVCDAQSMTSESHMLILGTSKGQIFVVPVDTLHKQGASNNRTVEPKLESENVRLLLAHDGHVVTSLAAACYEEKDSRAYEAYFVSAGSDGGIQVWSRDLLPVCNVMIPDTLSALKSPACAAFAVSIACIVGKRELNRSHPPPIHGKDAGVAGHSEGESEYLHLSVGKRTGELVQFELAQGHISNHVAVATGSPCGSELLGLATHPYKPLFATTGGEKAVKLWDYESLSLRQCQALPGPGRSTSFSCDGNLLAVGLGGREGTPSENVRGIICLFQTETMVPLFEQAISDTAITHIQFSPKDGLVAFASASGQILIFKVNGRQLEQRYILSGHTAPVTHVDFSVDSRRLRSVDTAHCLRFWDVTSGKELNVDNVSMSNDEGLPAYESLRITSTEREKIAANELAEWTTRTCELGWAVAGLWPIDDSFVRITCIDSAVVYGQKREEACRSTATENTAAAFSCLPVRGRRNFALDDNTMLSNGQRKDQSRLQMSNSTAAVVCADSLGRLRLFKYPCFRRRSACRAYSGHCASWVSLQWSHDASRLLTVGAEDSVILQWRHERTETPDFAGALIEPQGSGSRSNLSNMGLLGRASVIAHFPTFRHEILHSRLSQLQRSRPKSTMRAHLPHFKTFFPPTGAALTLTGQSKISNHLLPSKIQLDWVYGAEPAIAAQSIGSNKQGHVIFMAGSLIVIQNLHRHEQRFCMGLHRKLSAMNVSKNGRFIVGGYLEASSDAEREKWSEYPPADIYNRPSLLTVWESTTGMRLCQMPPSIRVGVAAVVFTPDSQCIVAVGMNPTHSLHIYSDFSHGNWTKVQEIARAEHGPDPVHLLVVSSRLHSMAVDENDCWPIMTGTLTGENNLFVWQVQGSTLRQRSAQWKAFWPRKAIQTCGIPLDQRDSSSVMITGSVNGDLTVWQNGSAKFSMAAHSACVLALAASSTRPLLLASASVSGQMKLWDTDLSELCFLNLQCDVLRAFPTLKHCTCYEAGNSAAGQRSPQSSGCDVVGMCWDGQGNLLLRTRSKGMLQLAGSKCSILPNGTAFNTKTVLNCISESHMDVPIEMSYAEGVSPVGPRNVVESCPTDPDVVATVGTDYTLRIWSVRHRRLLQSRLLPEAPSAIGWSGDGHRIAVGFAGLRNMGMIMMVHTEDLSTIEEFRPISAITTVIRFSPDDSKIVIGCADGSITIYTFSSTQKFVKGRLSEDMSTVVSIDFSVDGSVIQVCDSAWSLRYFNVADGSQIWSVDSQRDTEWATWTSPIGWGVKGIHQAFANTNDPSRLSIVFGAMSPHGIWPIEGNDDFQFVEEYDTDFHSQPGTNQAPSDVRAGSALDPTAPGRTVVQALRTFSGKYLLTVYNDGTIRLYLYPCLVNTAPRLIARVLSEDEDSGEVRAAMTSDDRVIVAFTAKTHCMLQWILE